MPQPNYEAEVKRVYTDAAIAPIGAFGMVLAYFIEDLATGERLAKPVDYELCWQVAYNTLKQQGKL